MRVAPILAILVGVISCGCSLAPEVSINGSAATRRNQNGPDLRGRWKASISMPETSGKKSDADKFGEVFTKMILGMFGNIKLKIQDDNAYTLTLMGVPLEGHYKVKGSTIHFKPEKAMGKTAEEWRKMEKDGKAQGNATDTMQEMDADISADLQSITLRQSGKDSLPLVFKRITEVDESKLQKNVTEAEAAYVGHWKGSMTPPPSTAKPKTPEEEQMARMMLDSLELNLHQDNTFSMDIMFELSGTWKIEGKQLVLHPTKMMGFSDDDSADKSKTKKPDEMKFNMAADGKTISASDPKDHSEITFTKSP